MQIEYTLFDTYFLDGLKPQTVKLWQIPARDILEAVDVVRQRLREAGVPVHSPNGIQVLKAGAQPIDMVIRRMMRWPEFTYSNEEKRPTIEFVEEETP